MEKNLVDHHDVIETNDGEADQVQRCKFTTFGLLAHSSFSFENIQSAEAAHRRLTMAT